MGCFFQSPKKGVSSMRWQKEGAECRLTSGGAQRAAGVLDGGGGGVGSNLF